MNFGKMDRRITIERVVETADALGGIVSDWETLRECAAQYLPVGGVEIIRFGQQIHSEQARFYIRFFEGLTPKDRINFDGKLWDIKNIKQINRREGLEILGEVSQ